MQRREQTYYILGAVVLLALLFFGFDTKPSAQKAIEKSRVLNTPSFDIRVLQSAAKTKLDPEQLSFIETIESQVQFATVDTVKLNYLKQLSGYWFQLGKPLIAGYYARQIAESEETALSWSITGTTFAAAVSNDSITEQDKLIAREQAIAAFENAISIEPSVIEHRVNQALMYIEVPDAAQPMKGVQMLAALAAEHPDSALPAYHLARLALRTGQVDRAKERIEQVLSIDSTNARTACLAVDIYRQAADSEKANRWQELCATLK